MKPNLHSRLFVALLVLPPLAFYMITLLNERTVAALIKEDGVVEYFGAFCFLATAVAFLVSFEKRRNIFYLLFGMVFLLGFLEEVSYGQRIFGYATPAFFQQHNIQNEVNLHNLEWFHGTEASGAEKGTVGKLLNMDRLFSLFWFGYCLLIPLLCYASLRAAKMANRIRLPMVPLAIGMMFLLNYLAAKVLGRLHPFESHGVIEIKETNSAYLFALFSVLELASVLVAARAAGATVAFRIGGDVPDQAGGAGLP